MLTVLIGSNISIISSVPTLDSAQTWSVRISSVVLLVSLLDSLSPEFELELGDENGLIWCRCRI